MEACPIQKLFDREPIRGNTILHELAKLGSLELLNRIRDNVDEPCNSILEKKNDDGEFSTHVVARYHSGQCAIKLMEALVKLGADLNAAEESEGFTILHDTVMSGDYQLAEWLCQQPGIDLDLKTSSGLTAYELAFREMDIPMMDLFREYGAKFEDL